MQGVWFLSSRGLLYYNPSISANSNPQEEPWCVQHGRSISHQDGGTMTWSVPGAQMLEALPLLNRQWMPLVHHHTPFQRKHVNTLKCAQAHTHQEQGAPAIHHTSHCYIICLHSSFSSLLASYSFIAHDEDKGQMGRRWRLLRDDH